MSTVAPSSSPLKRTASQRDDDDDSFISPPPASKKARTGDSSTSWPPPPPYKRLTGEEATFNRIQDDQLGFPLFVPRGFDQVKYFNFFNGAWFTVKTLREPLNGAQLAALRYIRDSWPEMTGMQQQLSELMNLL